MFTWILILLNAAALTLGVMKGGPLVPMCGFLVSLFLVRSRLSFKMKDSVYLLKPDTLVLMVIVIYVVPVVLDASLGKNLLQLHEPTLLKYMSLIVSFSFAFFMVTSSLHKPFVLTRDRTAYRDQSGYTVFAYILIGIGLLLFLYMVYIHFGGFANLIRLQRLEYYKKVNGIGIFLAGVNILRFGWIYLYILHLTSKDYKHKMLVHWILLTGFCLFFLAQGERGIWVKLLVSIGFVHFFFNRVHARYLLVIILVGIVGLQLFSKFRLALDRTDLTMGDMMEMANSDWLNLASGETGAHFEIANDVLNDPELSRLTYGRVYIDSILNLIPQVIWPSRDEYVRLPHVEYMKKYHSQRFKLGGGKAYSFFLECYKSFWYFGPFLMGALMGLFLNLFFRKAVLEKPNALTLAFYAATFGSLILLVRSPFAGIIKNLLISGVLPYIFIRVLIFMDQHINWRSRPMVRPVASMPRSSAIRPVEQKREI